jgi:predicted anti-sigma-YlaC factor YlaD
MYCSACGQALVPGQPVCTQCGRPIAATIPLVPNLDFQIQTYASRIRALSIVWFIYGGLSLALGFIGMTAASTFLHGGWGQWGHSYGPNWWFAPAMLRFGWSLLIVRSALALIAGWGLMERTTWGRVVAIVAAIFSLIRIPIGTALGIWTLVTLLGYRNTTLYERL